MIIPINKKDIPYRFDIELARDIYTFEINYNVAYDFFTMDLLLGEDPIFYGKKLILNRSLFADIVDIRLPNTMNIVPKSNTEKRITWENFGEKVLLAVEVKS